MKIISDFGKFFWVKIEKLGNKIFTPAYNPFYHLGGICFHLMYLLFITGVYLLFYYTISVTESYKSLQYLMTEQWYLGGVMRSLHRYATDGLMLVMGLHLLREFFMDRYRFYRWVAWFSGVGLLFTIWITALIGYWMVWDTKAQIVGLFTAELMDYFIYLNEPMSMNFLAPSSLTDIFFFVILFFHISVPTFLLFIAWLHYARTSKPRVNPPALLSVSILTLLVGLSFLAPAPMGEPADLTKIPGVVNIDWFLMIFFPLLAKTSAATVWATIGGLFLFLAVLPWIPGGKKPEKSKVILDECTGCGLCHDDCPYEAIIMAERKDESPYEMEAQVIPERCAECGICLGSCDYDAIKLGSWTNPGLKEEVSRLMASGGQSKDAPNIMAFTCDKGIKVKEILGSQGKTVQNLPSVKVINLPCAGMINPIIVEHAMKSGADGVFISGCGSNDCYFRTGNTWLEKRLDGSRPPALKKEVDPGKVRTYFEPDIKAEDFIEKINGFMEDLKGEKLEKAPPAKPMFVPAILVLALPAILIGFLSNYPMSLMDSEKAILKIGLKHKTSRVYKCTKEDIIRFAKEKTTALPGSKKVSQHMDYVRRKGEQYCGKRERNPAFLEIFLDGKKVYSNTFSPAGLHSDGPIFFYKKVVTDPGEHRVQFQMRDSERKEGFDYLYDEVIRFEKGRVVAYNFDKHEGGFKLAK